MKKAIFLLLILGASLSVFGQQRSTLRGKVIDDQDSSPLFGATVVVDSVKNGMVDETGAFTVTDIPRGEALVEIYSIGYVTVTQTVNFNQATIDLGTIRMKEDANAIEEVVVTAAANPVIQRGDTTQFNAEAFKTNPDAYAADLLAKMPGMEVTSSGVTAQGESVARVYVNDELLFGDDAMAALSNLSADMVESIQMFDELPDEARFSGFNDGQTQRALNIVTKGAIEKVIDARVSGGYGQELQRDLDGKYQPRYDIGGQMSYIASGTMFNLNGILNNLNQNQFGGGRFSGRGGRGGGGLQTIKNLGGGYTATWNETSTLNLTYNYFGNDTKQNSLNIRDYYPAKNPDGSSIFDTRIERDTTASTRGNDNHNGSLRYEYEGTKDRIMVTASGSLSSNDGESYSLNEDNRDGKPFSTTEQNSTSDGSNYSVRANASWQHKLGEKAGRTIGIQGNVTLSNNDSEQISISDVTREATDERIYLNTNNNSVTRNFGANINYNEPLSDKLMLNFRYSPSYNYSSTEKLITDEFGTLDEAVSERFTYDYFTQRGRVGLSYNQQDKFNFTVSVNGQVSSQAKTIDLPKRDDPNFERDFTSILPTVSVRYYVNRTKYFNLNYNANSSMPSLERLSTVVDVSNPLRYTSGNPNLKQSYGHSLNLRYNANNVEKLTNFSASIRASVTQNSVQNKTRYFAEDTYLPEYDFTFDSGTQLVTPVNVDGSVSLGANANYGFVFRPLRLNINLGGNYNYSRSPSYTGEVLNISKTNRMGFNISINSNISENVDFTVSSNTSYGFSKNSAIESRETISQNVGAYLTYIFLGGFVFSTDFSYNYQNTLDEPFNIWNAYIGRKFLRDNSAEFRIEFNDILNQSRNYSYSYGTTYDTQSWSRVIGRYVIAKVTYRFNNMKNQASQYGPQGGFPGSGAIPGSGMMPGGMPAGGGMRGGMPGGGAPMMGPGRF